MKIKKSLLFLIIYIFLFFLFYYKSLSIEFFADDYFFLTKTKISSFSEFINFLNPIRDVFYRPLSSELFYFFIQLSPNPLLTGHIITILVFLLTNLFLYKIITELTQSKKLGFITITFYSFHVSRVYQLYWLATFQEILMTFFLTLSLWFLLQKKNLYAFLSFFLALLCKETAIIYPIFLLSFNHTIKNKTAKENFKLIFPFLLLSLIFFFIYRVGLNSVEKIKTYTPILSLKLMINNLIWYSLWSVGLSSIFPNYFPSLISPPLPKFYSFFNDLHFILYISFLSLFLMSFLLLTILLFSTLKTLLKQKLKILFFLLISYLLFLLPFLPIQHKWMVRLTIPTIFSSLFFSYIIYMGLFLQKNKIKKIISLASLIFYLCFNFWGVKFEEKASTFLLETRIINKAKKIFSDPKLNDYKKIIIYQKPTKQITWISIEKLKVTFHNKSFFKYYFPSLERKIIFSFKKTKNTETKIIPVKELFY